MAAELRLDLAELDAEAANLDLVVIAPQVFDGAIAITPPAADIARAVKSRAGRGVSIRERVGDKALGRQLGTIQIAARHADAADVDLAGDADGNRLQLGIEDVDAGVGDRLADRRVAGLVRTAQVHAGAHCGFRRPVGIVKIPTARPVLRHRRRAGFTGHDQSTQGLQLQIGRPGADGHWRQRGMGDPPFTNDVAQRIAGHQVIARRQMQAGAVAQRHGEFPGAGVETERGELQHAAVGVDGEGAPLQRRQVAQATVMEQHALRLAGRARGVDDVGQVVRGQAEILRLEVGLRLQRDRRPVAIQLDDVRILRGQSAAQPLLGKNQTRRRVAEHVLDAFDRIRGIDRQVGGARLEHAEHGDDHLQAALDADGDDAVGAETGTRVAQMARQLVGARVEFGVAETLALEGDGDSLGLALGLRFEKLMEELVVGVIRLRRVPVDEHPLALFNIEQRIVAEAGLRLSDDLLEQALEMRRHAPHRGFIEQIGVVFEEGRHTLGTLLHAQGDVELGDTRIRLDLLENQVESGKILARRRLQDKHHLEQRTVAEIALGLQALDDLFKRQILMREGAKRGFAHLGEQVDEALLQRQLAAHDQRIHEEADQSLDLGAVAIGDRRSNTDIALSRIARQQGLKAGEQHHEQRCPFAAGEFLQPLGQRTIHPEAIFAAAIGLHRRTLPVGWQVEHRRRAGKPARPVAELPLQSRAAEPLPLPLGEVLVLDDELGERRGASFDVRGVQHGDFQDQHAHRPAVGNDVMHVQQQHMLALAKTQQLGTNQRSGGDIEGLLRVGAGQSKHLRLAARRRDVAQLAQRQRQAELAGDDLARHAVDGDERRAQRLVTAHDLVEDALKHRAVELPMQTHRAGHVVERPTALRRELFEEPEALLCIGQPVELGRRNRRHARLDRAERGLLLAEKQREAMDRVMFEQQRRRKREAEALLQHVADLQRGQRIDAQRRERLVRIGRRDAGGQQRPLDQRGDFFETRRLGRATALLLRRSRRLQHRARRCRDQQGQAEILKRTARRHRQQGDREAFVAEHGLPLMAAEQWIATPLTRVAERPPVFENAVGTLIEARRPHWLDEQEMSTRPQQAAHQQNRPAAGDMNPGAGHDEIETLDGETLRRRVILQIENAGDQMRMVAAKTLTKDFERTDVGVGRVIHVDLSFQRGQQLRRQRTAAGADFEDAQLVTAIATVMQYLLDGELLGSTDHHGIRQRVRRIAAAIVVPIHARRFDEQLHDARAFAAQRRRQLRAATHDKVDGRCRQGMVLA